MAKKTIARARLVKGKRWYIDLVMVDMADGTERRVRREFDLNTIEDKNIREIVGRILIKYLDDFLPQSMSEERHLNESHLSVAQAVDMALQIKISATRPNTHKGFKSVSRKFLDYCAKKQLQSLPVAQFTRRYAHDFWDHLSTSRRYRGNTLNTILAHIKSLWQELVEREICATNPWRGIKLARREEKLRRPFTPEEKRLVAAAAAKNDYWLFRAILLQYYCFIRPVELTRLRFRNFDLGSGVVTVESHAAKSWKKRSVTLPASIMHFFRDGVFDRFAGNYYVFGFEMKPGIQPASVNRLYKRHLKLLSRLKKEGALISIEGLTWYSWKDTGITTHAHVATPLATRDQAGHSDMKFTMMYYHADPINAQYRDLPEDLLQDL